MWMRMNLACLFYCLLLIIVIGTENAYTEQLPAEELMVRRIRPKMMGISEELKKYLELVGGDSNRVRTRYGKRGNIAPISELNAIRETLKMVLAYAQRQDQQRRQEKLRQEARKSKPDVTTFTVRMPSSTRHDSLHDPAIFWT